MQNQMFMFLLNKIKKGLALRICINFIGGISGKPRASDILQMCIKLLGGYFIDMKIVEMGCI